MSPWERDKGWIVRDTTTRRLSLWANGLFYPSLKDFTSGVPDQYADGKAAKVWQQYIGDKNDRTTHYRDFLVERLKKNGCHHILDVACGTG